MLPSRQAEGTREIVFSIAAVVFHLARERKGGEKIEISRRQTVKFKEMMSF